MLRATFLTFVTGFGGAWLLAPLLQPEAPPAPVLEGRTEPAEQRQADVWSAGVGRQGSAPPVYYRTVVTVETYGPMPAPMVMTLPAPASMDVPEPEPAVIRTPPPVFNPVPEAASPPPTVIIMPGSRSFARRFSRASAWRREREEALDRVIYQYRRQGGSLVPDVRATRGARPMMDPSMVARINQIEGRAAQAAAATPTADSRGDGYF